MATSTTTFDPTSDALKSQQLRLKTAKLEEVEKAKQLAAAKFNESQAQYKKEKAAKREKLLAVNIDRTEAAAIAAEFCISKDLAEMLLRERNGNVTDTINFLLDNGPSHYKLQ